MCPRRCADNAGKQQPASGSRSLDWDFVSHALRNFSRQHQEALETKYISQHLLVIAKLWAAAFVVWLVLFSLPWV